jgi:hypothetical protein
VIFGASTILAIKYGVSEMIYLKGYLGAITHVFIANRNTH